MYHLSEKEIVNINSNVHNNIDVLFITVYEFCALFELPLVGATLEKYMFPFSPFQIWRADSFHLIVTF